MSTIILFFVAPDDAVAASTAGGRPDHEHPSAQYGNFDIWASLDEWESILLDRPLDDVMAAGGPDVLSDDDGPEILRLPDALTRALAGATSDALEVAADRWTALRADEGEEIDRELAHEIVHQVADLAMEARRGGGLYCWIS